MAVGIGALIRQRRTELGISRERLAYESGLSLSTMLRIENVDHVPRADRLAAIARVLGVTADDLLGETAA